MKKQKKLMWVLAGALAVGAYRATTGKGIFNKIRFKDEHDAISNYMLSNHPGAFYSDIVKTGEGWSCIINDGYDKYLLYINLSEDGTYIFAEKKIEK